ncbi:MAG: TRAP transporter large permease subunit [Hyphomicrobiales bacterium]|nr:TRAP transporter large permease subunit [Hyphomicrobiales bacterium]MCP5372071.1 TRAP transporter large permease subunit [Hyphomicrobiales bacterium]
MGAVEFSLIFFGCMFLFLALGIPIAVALGGLSVILVWIFWGGNALSMLILKSYSMTSSFELLAVPLFIFMANMLERSRIADDLYDAMSKFAGKQPGGLAAGTIVICMIFAAMSGISGAATVSMGILALPAMLARGYKPTLAAGTIAAGGSLGILIPPSVTMIIYAIVAEVSVGKLYAAGVLPGLLLVGIFLLYIFIRARLQPEVAPPLPDHELASWPEKLASLKGLIFPIFLVVGVLGSILLGIASISEAAAVGAAGSIVATVMKRGFQPKMFHETAVRTLLVTSLIFWIVIGASAFATLYTAMGAAGLIKGLILGLEVNRYIIMFAMMAILLVMGMVIETTGIIMIAVPVMTPITVSLGFDPIWFGILFIINMEIGFLTPPFGYNLFYLKGVAPKSISLNQIYLSVVPYVLLMIAGLALCIAFPEIILWLPSAVFG